MPATPEDLFRRLDELGIATTTVEHPPLFTVEDSKALRGQLPGGHCKSLYLRDKKKRNYLVVALEDQAVDLGTLPDRIGAGRLSFGSADRLMEFLGVIPGSVTPFALINDPEQRVNVVLHKAMLEHDPLNYHPLVNTMTTAIRPDDLLKFIRAGGHEPTIVDL
ncbi:MAG: prolyl-tRNA synthetase associated domain-containing protein [Alphaproteobacteria bacterium]